MNWQMWLVPVWLVLAGVVVVLVVASIIHDRRAKPETDWERINRELNESCERVMVALGNALKPSLEATAKALNDLAEALEEGS